MSCVVAVIVHKLIVSAASKTGASKMKSSILNNNNQAQFIAFVNLVDGCEMLVIVNKKRTKPHIDMVQNWYSDALSCYLCTALEAI